MSRITIIAVDNTVTVDEESQRFDFREDIDPNIWAVQWTDDRGHEEYKDGTPNKDINTMEPYQKILDQHEANKTIVAFAKQTDLDIVTVVYLSGLDEEMSVKGALAAGIDFEELSELQKDSIIRGQARHLIMETSYMMPPDIFNTLSESEQESLLSYRAALLITLQDSNSPVTPLPSADKAKPAFTKFAPIKQQKKETK